MTYGAIKTSIPFVVEHTNWYLYYMDRATTTRENILEAAFDLIYRNGYQATSIDKIISKTQVTKGAFYYHFKNKDEMGTAVIKEIINPSLNRNLLNNIRKAQDPIEDIYSTIKNKLTQETDYQVENGCPTNNLVQEMSGVNVKFYKLLRAVLDNWINVIEATLEEGIIQNKLRKDIDCKSVAQYIIAGYEGVKGLAKVYGRDIYNSYLSELQNYLITLK